MHNKLFNLNTATFVGIDAHPTEHTAVAINRFEEEKGMLRFENTKEGIEEFLLWLPTIEANADKVVIGIEGRGTSGNAIVKGLLKNYPHVYEVNPLYTKQRRTLGTKGKKSDPVDAKLIAEVVTKKVAELPRITSEELSIHLVNLKRLVWFYEEITVQGARLKNQLHKLQREEELSTSKEEGVTVSFIVAQKQKELAKIKKIQQSLKPKLATLLTTAGINLTTIPGINIVLAAKITSYTNGIHRFANRDKYLQYAGIGLLERSSGKVKRHVQNNKGNRHLNSVFYLVAVTQTQWNQKTTTYYRKKIAEGKTKKHALRCVMKRVACIVYGMMNSGEAYRA